LSCKGFDGSRVADIAKCNPFGTEKKELFSD
jgi:hypothetical protein